MRRLVLISVFLWLSLSWGVAQKRISVAEALADTVPGSKWTLVETRDTMLAGVHDTMLAGVHDTVLVHDTILRPLTWADSLLIMRQTLHEEWNNLASYGLQPIEGVKAKTVLVPLTPIEQQEILIKEQKRELSPWTRSLFAMVQASQNYISKNWHSGGQGNIALVGKFVGNLSYSKNKFQWDNQLEWRWGFNSVQGDTLRKIETNDDLFRLNSKVNYKAFGKSWFYSGNFEIQTYFFRTYKETNSPVLKTKFFSPLRVNIGVGLDCKPTKGISISFLPLTYKVIHVYDTTNVDASSFGILPGHKTLAEVGSSIKISGTVTVVRNIDLTWRYYLYTNYKDLETELEFSADFHINRFLSAHIMVYPRYCNQESKKIQFKEFASIGFSHTFQ